MQKEVCQSIGLHSEGHPINTATSLKHLALSVIISKDIKYDILKFAEKGLKGFEDFVGGKLKSPSTVSVWHLMKKRKLKAWNEKTKIVRERTQNCQIS